MRFLIARTPSRMQLVDRFDHVKNTELMLDVLPGTLQSIFVERRAIGHGHLHLQSAIFEGL